ncbi:MAG: family 43 glycosylhydrolase [Deltaproteobacteria bacterium]|nr:family 43 glycosylhydrolase [Deltaproteobacteria bacterium]
MTCSTVFCKIGLALVVVLIGFVAVSPKVRAYSVNKEFQLIVDDFADTTVAKVSDDEYYISGTRGRIFIYRSSDLNTADLFVTYDPDMEDSSCNYCWIWAPDLSFDGDQFVLLFSAIRIQKETLCSDYNFDDIRHLRTSFMLSASDLDSFGVPQSISFDVDGVVYSSSSGRSEQNLLVDAAIEGDRFFYNWNVGDNISSIKMSEPRNIIRHTVANNFGEPINEGPGLFVRNNIMYFFYSRHRWTGSYTSSYLYGDDIWDLVRNESNSYDFASPIQQPGCGIGEQQCIFENAGHGDITSRYGQYYYVYHRYWPHEREANPTMKRRAYVTPIYFHPDGKIVSISKTRLQWDSLGVNFRYALNLRLKDGSWVWNCQALEANTSFVFNGLCNNPGMGVDNVVVHKGEIDLFRIDYGENGNWGPGQYHRVRNDLSEDSLDLGGLTNASGMSCAMTPSDTDKALTAFIITPEMNSMLHDTVTLEGRANIPDLEIGRYVWVDGLPGTPTARGENCRAEDGVLLYAGTERTVTIPKSSLLDREDHHICLSIRKGGPVSDGGEWAQCKDVVSVTQSAESGGEEPDGGVQDEDGGVLHDGGDSVTSDAHAGDDAHASADGSDSAADQDDEIDSRGCACGGSADSTYGFVLGFLLLALVGLRQKRSCREYRSY